MKNEINFENIKQLDKAYVMNNYNRFDVAIESGKGTVCKDYDNKEYIDFTSGIGVNSFGYCDDVWAEAVCSQTKKLNHSSNLYYTNPDAVLAKLICEKSGAKKVSFANSGAEANECAIKAARKYSFDKYGEKAGTIRHKIITLKNSFHGRTITTLSATGQDVFHKYFNPFTDGFLFAQANNFESVKSLANEDVCGIILEPIQGEGGVIPLEKEFVKQVYSLCKGKDILLIFDEVQTGIGRCGTFFASEQFSVKPDIITSAKGLGGGLPIGATLFFEKCENVFSFGDHGTTFGGNPICCAGAISIIERIDDNFLNAVKQKGNFIKKSLLQCDLVNDVCGLGLMIGISLKGGISSSDVAKKCIQNGLLVLTAKEKIRLLPPLNISFDNLEKGIEILKQTINSFKNN